MGVSPIVIKLALVKAAGMCHDWSIFGVDFSIRDSILISPLIF